VDPQTYLPTKTAPKPTQIYGVFTILAKKGYDKNTKEKKNLSEDLT